VNVAMGWKAHSGWAALVALGEAESGPQVIDRRRVELVEEEWAKQPYHAAEKLAPEDAHKMVARGIEAARRIAVREMRAVVQREAGRGHTIAACAVLVGSPMPDWSTDQILAVHFRMHKAEGVLFRDALARAAQACGLQTLTIPEKQLLQTAGAALSMSPASLSSKLTALGASIGPPWAKDQKDAALAAFMALHDRHI